MIGCVRLPHVAAALEQRARPDLGDRPFALVDDEQGVYGVSAEAARRGARAGMTLRQAQAVCSDLLVIPATPAHYRRAFDDLLEGLTHFTPQVEAEEGLELRADARRRVEVPFLRVGRMDDPPAPTCYLDLGALRDDAVVEMAGQLHDFIRQQAGLAACVGLAGGRFPARVAAATLAPGETLIVPEDDEAAFLAGFTVMLLPVDGETLRQLHLLGLHPLGEVAALPVAAVVDRFGKAGRVLHRLAQGRDTSPVRRYAPRVTERLVRHLDGPVSDAQVLEQLLDAMTSDLAGRLQAAGQAAQQIVLTLTVERGDQLEREVTLRQPRADADHLRRTVRELAQSLNVSSGVIEVELALGEIEAEVPRQLSLFDREPVSQTELRAALERLAAHYGDEGFYWARVADPDARLPERRVRLERVSGG
jgi:nucleotidyltransferase/DNA polymerase involved in DNA repair